MSGAKTAGYSGIPRSVAVAALAAIAFAWLAIDHAGRVEMGSVVAHPVTIYNRIVGGCDDYTHSLADAKVRIAGDEDAATVSDADARAEMREYNEDVFRCRRAASVTGRWSTPKWVDVGGWLALATFAAALVTMNRPGERWFTKGELASRGVCGLTAD